jgi:hypothetical protein
MKTSPQPVTPIHTFSIASLLVMRWVFQNGPETKHQSMQCSIVENKTAKAQKFLLVKVKDQNEDPHFFFPIKV